MIKKTTIKNSDKMSVTFETTAFPAAQSLHIAGEFNGWDPGAHAMKQRKDGTWSITLRLPREAVYEYRYVVNGTDWVTDAEAESTRPNQYGSHNAVLVVG